MELGTEAQGLRASRRNLVRGAAWSVPVVAVATAAPAFAASTCASPRSFLLNWGSVTYNHSGNTSYATVPSSPAGQTIYVHFSTVFRGRGRGDGNIPGSSPSETRNLSVPPGSGNNGTLQDPVITNLGGLGSGERGVRLQQISPQGYNNRQDLTVTFRSSPSPSSALVAVQGLSFSIVDIDNLASPAYADRVALSSTVSFDQTKDDDIRGSGTVNDPWFNADSGNQNENAAGARVKIDFPDDNLSRISTFTLSYWTNTGASGNNTGQYHRIYLSDFSLKTCP
ncbi:hypothetical protein [Nocardioides lacusdianchii]|uniref:hypothetical protein n=1 Tax=Nocardioides lacusdianchii TaxID=2783664 RepID=UPI001CCBECB9|nr:hypothetical protein [Nocardioides lacusdianchii]